MASSLNGYLTVFHDNTYIDDFDTLVNTTILDGDVYGFTDVPDEMVCQFVDLEYSLTGGLHGSPLGGILLDINDGTNYCIDEIEFPPPRPRIEWRDPSHGDGRDVSFHKYENRIVTIRMQVYGVDEFDLADNVHALWEQLLVENPILEWAAAGALESLYFDLITPPMEINVPDWFETWIRDNGQIHVMSNVELILEAKPFMRGPEESVILLNGSVASPDVVNCVTGIVLDETYFKGDVPAPADIFIDKVDGDLWTDLIFGQRLKYHDDFDPIQDIGTVTPLVGRLGDDYTATAPLTNLILNPSFETAGAGAPDYWANWTETPSGNPGTVLRNCTVNPYDGVDCVEVGCPTDVFTHLHETITTTVMIAVDITKPYFASVYVRQPAGYPGLVTTMAINFYSAAPALLGWKYFSIPSPTTSWLRYGFYIYPGDFPALTTQVTIDLVLNSNPYIYGVGFHYWDLVTFSELTASTIQAEFPVDSHEGRYLPVGAVSFAATNANSDITLQAMLATSAGTEITPSINPMTVAIGDPNTKFVDVAMPTPRIPVITVPTHRISGLADKSQIDQIIRLSTESDNAEIFWYDYLGIVPIDRAYSEVRNWSGNDHLILDGRSSHLALTSLTGSLDDAQTWSINQQKGDTGFVADPQGFNGAIVALTNTSGDYEVTSVVDVTMKYSPMYLIMPSG
jgi:hypothetical protein